VARGAASVGAASVGAASVGAASLPADHSVIPADHSVIPADHSVIPADHSVIGAASLPADRSAIQILRVRRSASYRAMTACSSNSSRAQTTGAPRRRSSTLWDSALASCS
jgi:hypothetical protein